MTVAQQMMEKVQAATAPFQYAMATKSGCECIPHALQGLTEIDPRATVMSIDGISAFDLISLQGLMDLDGGSSALPFVALFYGTPSSYLWEDSCGRTHTIVQGDVALLFRSTLSVGRSASPDGGWRSSVGFPRWYIHRHDAGTGWRSSCTT